MDLRAGAVGGLGAVHGENLVGHVEVSADPNPVDVTWDVPKATQRLGLQGPGLTTGTTAAGQLGQEASEGDSGLRTKRWPALRSGLWAEWLRSAGLSARALWAGSACRAFRV